MGFFFEPGPATRHPCSRAPSSSRAEALKSPPLSSARSKSDRLDWMYQGGMMARQEADQRLGTAAAAAAAAPAEPAPQSRVGGRAASFYGPETLASAAQHTAACIACRFRFLPQLGGAWPAQRRLSKALAHQCGPRMHAWLLLWAPQRRPAALSGDAGRRGGGAAVLLRRGHARQRPGGLAAAPRRPALCHQAAGTRGAAPCCRTLLPLSGPALLPFSPHSSCIACHGPAVLVK